MAFTDGNYKWGNVFEGNEVSFGNQFLIYLACLPQAPVHFNKEDPITPKLKLVTSWLLWY